MKKYLSDSLKEIFRRPDFNLKPLDGLRAFAIIFVVCMHVNELVISHSGYSSSFINSIPPFKGGWVGVPLFFVLSGFLIGGQLWKELQRTRNIAFWKFFLRRGLRIWPLYYVVMLIVYFFSISLVYDVKSLITNIFFLGNYLPDTGPVWGSWSLATEEQFYILAPIAILFINKIFPERSLRFYRNILLGVFFLPLVARFLSWDINGFDLNTYMATIYRPIHTNSEGLIGGMILSNMYLDRESFYYRSKMNTHLLLFISLAIFFLSFYSKVYFNFTGIAIGFTALMFYTLKEKNLFSQFLSHDYFFIISKTSFCIYLIHIHVIRNLINMNLVRKLSFGVLAIEPLVAFAMVMLISILISIVLYVLVERPFLMVREKVLLKLK